MKRVLMLIMFSVLMAGSMRAAEAVWLTDYDKAVAQAAAEKKPLVIDFTGSDWCIWCHRLDGEVFSTPEFVDYAQKNLVLLKLDFPRKTELPEALKEQNQMLAKKYEIRGYPTVIVLNSSAEKIGKLGYKKGGPGNWIPALEAFTKK